MFKRPEEFIVAVLAALWVAASYFAAARFGAPAHTALLIAVLTLLWAIVFFLLWQRERTRLLWPLFLGLLAACWWPMLDWYAVRGIVPPETAGEMIVIAKPWYASWTFKIILALIPAAAGYAWMFKTSRRDRGL
ncbi:hypothetical protein [Neisseria bacilliformis]|uniref:hypothetical protein n=1 Tax=Neisseria bacilliformis TaxID=267212 RepID=UPI0028E7D274|nr:hypothetical protein [Neisseria bacilliformis]